MSKARPFWEIKSLSDMTVDEWEALCDGCGKCCLHKLEDLNTHKVHYTHVACRLLDTKTIHCTNYVRRKHLVPDCLQLSPDNITLYKWLPKTCAYRLLAEGKPLYNWHPLISGRSETVHEAGISVKGKCISEREAGDLQNHLWSELE